jgi:nitrite reductase/ring-hydroxylating ferredoxin subunit/DMSO/TMAO reductase YedYZ heme-binding membrane subunit
MGNNYLPVLWNKQKKRYDKLLLLGIALLAFSLVGLQFLIDGNITPETLIIRTSAIVAIVLLHFILILGPLCRLNSAYLPLLYNRRHLGVTMFVFALIHGGFSIVQFHALGDLNPLVSVFLSNTKYLAVSQFPFQVLGFFALIILFLMAATSHDFWLRNLGPRIWKSLHMLVYVAYALIILHVALGALQSNGHPVYWAMLVLGFGGVAGLHLAAGFRERNWLKNQEGRLKEEGFYQVCPTTEIPDDCAKGVFIDGQNIAIFKYDNKVSAVNNVCRHQMGPLSEGKIVDGCITCPWHGYQYLPENGQAPPPFTEKLETYNVKILDGEVWVNPTPHPEGTFLEPAILKA